MNSIGIKSKYIYIGILISLVGVLGGSLSHLSYTFGTLEQDGSGMISFIISAGIEFGQLAIAMGVAERRRQKKSAKDLIFYLFCFAFINFFGNVYHSASVYTGILNLKMENLMNIDRLVSTTIFILSGALPVLALSLTELQSIFFQKWQTEKIMEEKMKRDAEKELEKSTAKSSRKTPAVEVAEFTMLEEKKPDPVPVVVSKPKSVKKKSKITPATKKPAPKKSAPKPDTPSTEPEPIAVASVPVVEVPKPEVKLPPAPSTPNTSEFIIAKKPIPVIEKKPVDKIPTLFHPEDEENDPAKPVTIDALSQKRRVTIPTK